MQSKKLFGKSDIVIILICLLIAGACFLPKIISKTSLTAVVTVDGEVYSEINFTSLKKEQTIEVNSTVIKADSDGIYFSQSDCKDKICIKSEKISHAGDSAACIPNRVAVYIKSSNSKSDIDGVAY